jgi:hypothetical protein
MAAPGYLRRPPAAHSSRKRTPHWIPGAGCGRRGAALPAAVGYERWSALTRTRCAASADAAAGAGGGGGAAAADVAAAGGHS